MEDELKDVNVSALVDFIVSNSEDYYSGGSNPFKYVDPAMFNISAELWNKRARALRIQNGQTRECTNCDGEVYHEDSCAGDRCTNGCYTVTVYGKNAPESAFDNHMDTLMEIPEEIPFGDKKKLLAWFEETHSWKPEGLSRYEYGSWEETVKKHKTGYREKFVSFEEDE